MNKDNRVLLHLSLISGIGPLTVLKITKKLYEDFCNKNKNPHIQKLDLNLDTLYSFKVFDFINNFELSKKISENLKVGLQDFSLLEKELNLITKHQINIVSFLDQEYPENLKQIYSPPIILYCKGASLQNFQKNIAIVGSRNATYYANQVIDNIVPPLIQFGYTIVSGGALGVDSIAHKKALGIGGKTIVVLGSGLLKPYPLKNKSFFENLVKNGSTLISSFPLLNPPEKGNFPARNRIIAGLSQGCIVVQAAKKSGALITGQFALDEGRQVFAVPGSIFEDVSAGCHNLIKQGAKLVGSIDDILEEFEDVFENKKIEKKICLGKKEKTDSLQNLILKNLVCAISLDELSLRVKLDINDLQEKLFDMQIKGLVNHNFGFWEIK